MKNKLSIFILFLAFGFLNVWAEGQSSPDCATAEDDIARLEQQKVSTGGGLLSITPIGLVADAVTSSDEDDKKEQDAKEHNSKIDAQIEEIRRTCNIQPEPDMEM